MSFLEKHLSKFRGEKKENESGNEKIEQEKMPWFIEDKINQSPDSYDGNSALEREQWLEKGDVSTVELLAELHKEDSVKYSKESIAKILSVLDNFKSQHDFDIKYVHGSMPRTRLKLFPPTIRMYIIDHISGGSISNYDEKYLSGIIKGGKEYLEKIKFTTRRNKERVLEREEARKSRVSNFEKRGAGKQELLTTECPVLVIETHADNKFSDGALEDIDQVLPQEIDRHLLRINYQEGTLTKENEDVNETPQQYEEITDRSGEIGDKTLEKFIKNGEKANIVLTGGNLRGCLLSSMKCILSSIKKNKPEQVNINMILDKIYDNDAYDERNESPIRLFTSGFSINTEVYKDGKLIDVTESGTKDNPRVILRLWSKTENFSEKIKDSLELKKIRESI